MKGSGWECSCLSERRQRCDSVEVVVLNVLCYEPVKKYQYCKLYWNKNTDVVLITYQKLFSVY